jgi:hypothetical protein
VDYVRGLDNQVIPYNDDNEVQDVEPGSVLNCRYKNELSVDDRMYDGRSVYDVPGHRDAHPPLKDMYVLPLICMNYVF